MLPKILVDDNINFASEAFADLGEVTLVAGRHLTNEQVKKATAVILRSVTKVDRALLDNTEVRLVGTATIGTDHVDVDYLRQRGIAFASAAGCNADAVAEYVFTALAQLAVAKEFALAGLTIGVVGVGNIGSRVVRLARALGMTVLQNDPPRQRETGSAEFVALDALMDADIVTLHVPLNLGGVDNTYHLFDANRLQKLKPGAILINASRGAVVDNVALLAELRRGPRRPVVLDVWENEPNIAVELLSATFLGTPHIAGYSLEGKANGTQMMVDALARFLGKSPQWRPRLPAIAEPVLTVETTAPLEAVLHTVFSRVYAIRDDDARLRKIAQLPAGERPGYFDQLRKHYPWRREFRNYTVKLQPADARLANILWAFRFEIVR